MLQNDVSIVLCFALIVGISANTAFASDTEEVDLDQSQITWKTFQDRDNLFTAEYPSNWSPSGVDASMRAGPIDTIFYGPVADLNDVLSVELVQWGAPSVFRTANESLQAILDHIQSDPTVNKFEIERPMQCTSLFNGLESCNAIYEVHYPEEAFAVMVVDALAPNGTEYGAWYLGSFDLFERHLPTAEKMIGSFKTMGGSSAINDFSLGGGVSDSNTTGIADANTTGTLNDQDFSLGSGISDSNTTGIADANTTGTLNDQDFSIS